MFMEVLEGFGEFWVNPNTLEVGLDIPETLKAIALMMIGLKYAIALGGNRVKTGDRTYDDRFKTGDRTYDDRVKAGDRI